jgi:hypothetical protein
MLIRRLRLIPIIVWLARGGYFFGPILKVAWLKKIAKQK